MDLILIIVVGILIWTAISFIRRKKRKMPSPPLTIMVDSKSSSHNGSVVKQTRAISQKIRTAVAMPIPIVKALNQRATGKRYCLGITGLSQSGKTTFLTSLLNQLINFDRSSLPGFSPVLNGRLIGVRVHPLEDESIEQFPYDSAYRDIACNVPKWPNSTKDLSGCLIELKLSRKRRKLLPFTGQEFTRFFEVRDYPGEWLLDLPLIQMDYFRWCGQCSAQYSKPPRSALLGTLLLELQDLNPLEKVDKAKLSRLSCDFKKFLLECKEGRNGLSLIQPGRFLIPGEVDDPELLTFVPLLKCASYTDGQLRKAHKNSYYKICSDRYRKYVNKLVKPFYKKFCLNVDRQIVLVDVVNALNGGPEYVDDMRQALANIADGFSYGREGPLKRLFSRKIDRVVFAATKVDQVLSGEHDKIRQLLSEIVRQAYKDAQFEGVEPFCEAIAAVRSSKEIRDKNDPGIMGHSIDGTRIAYVHPEFPGRIPESDGWRPFMDWEIPRLSPPPGLSAQNNDVIPHIRLDTVINALIGDLCS